MRCYPMEKDVFIHALETQGHAYQGLTYEYGYMVEVPATSTVIDQSFEELDILYKMYRAYFTTMVRLLKRIPLYYLEIEYTDNIFMINLSEYVVQQDKALELSKSRGLTYIYSIHGKEHIHTKEVYHV